MLRMSNSYLKTRIAIRISSRVRYFANRSALQSWCYLPGRLSITTHARNKLIKANKFLFILRSRRVCLRQAELDYLFQSLIIPNLSYGLSVYGAVLMQRLRLGTAFLDRCHKRRYIYLSKAAQHLWLLEYLRMKNIKRNIQ